MDTGHRSQTAGVVLPFATASPTALLSPPPLDFFFHNPDGFWIWDKRRRTLKVRAFIDFARDRLRANRVFN